MRRSGLQGPSQARQRFHAAPWSSPSPSTLILRGALPTTRAMLDRSLAHTSKEVQPGGLSTSSTAPSQMEASRGRCGGWSMGGEPGASGLGTGCGGLYRLSWGRRTGASSSRAAERRVPPSTLSRSGAWTELWRVVDARGLASRSLGACLKGVLAARKHCRHHMVGSLHASRARPPGLPPAHKAQPHSIKAEMNLGGKDRGPWPGLCPSAWSREHACTAPHRI